MALSLDIRSLGFRLEFLGGLPGREVVREVLDHNAGLAQLLLGCLWGAHEGMVRGWVMGIKGMVRGHMGSDSQGGWVD